jgi:hypothetical protein
MKLDEKIMEVAADIYLAMDFVKEEVSNEIAKEHYEGRLEAYRRIYKKLIEISEFKPEEFSTQVRQHIAFRSLDEAHPGIFREGDYKIRLSGGRTIVPLLSHEK